MAIKENLVRTASELERKYNLKQLVGLKTKVAQNAAGVTKVNNQLNDYVASTLLYLDKSQDDVITWFYDYEPTLLNEPASEWITDYEEMEHHTGDLFYNTEKGTVYVFKYDSGFKWEELYDKDVIKSMAIANENRDVDDHMRIVFLKQPTTPYSVGDVWIRDDYTLYRCSVGRQEEDTFNENDWIKATDYSSETAAKNSIAQLSAYKTIVKTNFVTNSLISIDSDGINLKVTQIERVSTGNIQIFKEEPTTPYYVGDVYYIDYGEETQEIWVCQKEKLEGLYDSDDWSQQSTYSSSATLQLQANQIESKVSANGIASTINQTENEIYITSNLFGWQSDNSTLDTDGTLYVTSGSVGGWDITDSQLIKRQSIGNLDFDTFLQTISDKYKLNTYIVGFSRYAKGSTVDGDMIFGIKADGELYTEGKLYAGYVKSAGGIYAEGNLTVDGYLIGYLNLDSSGNTYINSEGCVINGQICATEFIPTSLAEKKKNFEELDKGLDIINNTKIYKYNLINEEDSHKKHIGFVIGEDYKYSHDITGIDKDGKEIGADTYSMVSVCFKAIQEQQEKIEELRKEIQSLKEGK